MLFRSVMAIVAASLVVLVAGMAAPAPAERYRPPVDQLEDYAPEPLPPGFSVQHTDVDGPVYVDADGMTLYIWPLNNLRNGQAGDRPNEASQCGNVKQTVTTGLMSPYPGGLLLPDLEIRPTCVALWPPV